MWKIKALKYTIEKWIEFQKGQIMKVKNTILAKGTSLNDQIKSLKGEELVQVIGEDTDGSVKMCVVITQEHYHEILNAKNSPANILYNDAMAKAKELESIAKRATNIAATLFDELKNPKK